MKKVNFLCLLALGIFFSACDSDDDTWGDWEKSDAFPGDYRVLATSFEYGNAAYVGMGYNSTLSTQDKFLRNFYKFDGKTWKNIEDFPVEGRRGSVAFVIGDTAFIGAGFREASSSDDKKDHYFSDFYKLNLKTEEWIKDGDEYAKTDISDFVDDKACKFWSGIGFELNGKGYVGTGQLDGRASKNIYEYDPKTGKWTAMTMPGDPRVGAVVFKLGGKAIICLGCIAYNNTSANVVDVYAFDGTDWEKKRPLQDLDGRFNDDYGKIPRSYAMAFTSHLDGEKGYICGGFGTKTAWEYRLDKDRWYEVTEFPSAMMIRVAGVAFTLNGYGYVTTGGSSYTTANDNSTWKFIPGVDEDDNNDY